MTTVKEVMTRGVKSLGPSDTASTAAQAMKELNVGVIPVCEDGKLLGMVTDRDIVVRGVAQGLDMGATRLSDIMSSDVRTAQEDDDLDLSLEDMAENQIRRLPVVDAAGKLVGIISLGDIASKSVDEEADVGESLAAISAPA
ncbi:MAG: CBS domain-containing protein [Pseudomonadota bacterium]